MKRIYLFLLMVCFAVSMIAAPAYRKPFSVKQSDGTVLTVVLTGDEALHYYTTSDGVPLVKDVNGDFYYATFSNGGFVSTKCLAHNNGNRSAEEKGLLSSIDFESMNSEISKASGARSLVYKVAAQKAGSQIAPEGDVNVAVLLVQFKDTKFTYTKEDLNNILNTKDYVYENDIANSIGSARDYFMAQSDGKFRPNFIVTDIVTLDNNMSYYGGNDTSGDDKKPTYMVKEGIQKADAAGFDFSICDNNGDGEVEFIYCIYAGYSESYGADENTIWPHQWQLSAEAGRITVDGVKCDTYACSGELVYNESYEESIGKTMAGVGLICHEFSHCLGLHDIYDTTYESGNWGMDYWDVMDQGNYAAEGYVPVGYSAYQRDFCGWRELVEINTKGAYSMQPLTQGGVAYKVVNDANKNEYYILENRKQEGWDTYLFNEGMLIIHVDYLKSAWDNNTINNTKGHPRYTLIPADGELAMYGEVSVNEFVESLKGDVWPGTSGNTELTNTSIPAAKVYTGGYMNKPIRDIEYSNNVILFNFMGGVFESAPQVLPATDVKENSFMANWESVEDADEYLVQLQKVSEAVGEGSGDSETLLAEDFVGFTRTNTDVQSSINEYTTVGGWECSKTYSEGGVIRVGTANNAGTLRTPELSAGGQVTVSFSTALYNSSDSGTILTVSIVASDGSVVATKDCQPSSSMKKYELSANVDGGFRVEFSTKNSNGKKRANVDNLVVTVVGKTSSEVIEEVVTDTTSFLFDGLDGGCKYRYRVKAMDAVGESAFSNYQVVEMLATSIEDLEFNGDYIEVYTLLGIKVYSGNSMPALSKGVYVVVTSSGARKIVVE